MELHTVFTTRSQQAETIAEITNLMALDLYRDPNYATALVSQIDGHLVDLSMRIIKALGQVPEPDEYETWLMHKKAGTICAGCSVVEGIKPTENEPVVDPDENNREASIDPDAELTTEQSRPPIDGGEPDTPMLFKESNETSTTAVQQQADKAGEDAVSGAAVVQPDTPNMFIEALRSWKKSEGLSNMDIQRLSGVSNVTVLNILCGKTTKPTPKTRRKLMAAIKAHKAKKKTINNTPVSPLESKANGTDPGAFLRLKLIVWMDHEHVGLREAAERLSVKESVLRDIKFDNKLPHPNIIRQLGRNIKPIMAKQTMLLAAAEQRAVA